MLKPPARNSSFVGHIFEFAVAQVVIERVAAVAGDVNILEAIVIVIGDGDAHAPAFAREAGGFRDVGELYVGGSGASVLMIERDQRVAAIAVALHGRAVDGDDVEFAVVIAVDKADASAHRLDDVFFVGRRNVRHR